MLKILGVIPARLGSSRLKEKVLKEINGRPMIQHVWERVSGAKNLSRVFVACDDQRIVDCVRSFGGEAVMTRADHLNGTSRVAEVAGKFDADVIVNIQGDEPMIHPSAIDALAEVFQRDKKSEVQVGTLAVPRKSREEYENPNVVKVICDARGDAIYFSRSGIPYYRDEADRDYSFLKHLGIYAYRRKFLFDFVSWKPGVLENFEKLEQLRILENGFKIRVVETHFNSISVDTAEDLVTVETEMVRSANPGVV